MLRAARVMGRKGIKYGVGGTWIMISVGLRWRWLQRDGEVVGGELGEEEMLRRGLLFEALAASLLAQGLASLHATETLDNAAPISNAHTNSKSELISKLTMYTSKPF